MRIAVGLLACIGAGALTSALADPPSVAAPAGATTAPASADSAPVAASAKATPAAAPNAATASNASAPPELGQEEKQLIAQGYRLEIHGNQKLFCRRETALGSHLPGPKVCASAERLKAAEAEAKEATSHVQTWAPGGTTGH
jgi:hypothetical protein